MWSIACLLLLALGTVDAASSYPRYNDFGGKPYQVTYDERALRLDNKPAVFVSGSIHYPRSSPDRWSQQMKAAAADGMNMIETYVFWNVHQPDSSDQMIMDGAANITRFLSEAAANNMFVNLRFGPYVCAEQNMGGLPIWLQFEEGILYRCSNTVWLTAVERWMNQIVEIVRPFFSIHGGPIVLAQIENELNGHGVDSAYVAWNGKLAESFNLSVPWLMCNGASDYPRTINSCNGRDCTKWLETNGQSHKILVTQPAIWTENEAWFEQWSDTPSPYLKPSNDRAPSEIAYSTMRFYARGGSLMNYYMYMGGLNYGRLGGGSMAQVYADGANYRGDFTPNEPKRSHLNKMHAVIESISSALVSAPAQLFLNKSVPFQVLGQSDKWINSSLVNGFYYHDVVFVENSSPDVIMALMANEFAYSMAAYSILILQWVGTSPLMLWNSSLVGNVTTVRDDEIIATSDQLKWSYWTEPLLGMNNSFDQWVVKGDRPLEQLSLVGDTSDYMTYSTQFTLNSECDSDARLSIDGQTSQAFIAFVDGEPVGTSDLHLHSTFPVATTQHIDVGSLGKGQHTLTLLSVNLGNENGVGAGENPAEVHYKGVRPSGSVTLDGNDITKQTWMHMPSLVGERLNATQGSVLVNWQPVSSNKQAHEQSLHQTSNWTTPMTWFQASFNVDKMPESEASFYVDMLGMSRGHVYINGYDVARYWLILSSDKLPTQQRYHIPSDVIFVGSNTIVMFDELGSIDLTTVQLLISRVKVVQHEGSHLGDTSPTMLASE